MKKLVFTSFVLLAFIACGKKDDSKNPMKPIDPKTDSQQIKDDKKAAQGQGAKDPAQPGADAPATSSMVDPTTQPQAGSGTSPGSTPGAGGVDSLKPVPDKNTGGNAAAGDSKPTPTSPTTPAPAAPAPAKPDADKTTENKTTPENSGDAKTPETAGAPEGNSEGTPDSTQADTKPEEKKDETPADTAATDKPADDKAKTEDKKESTAMVPFKFEKTYTGELLTLVHPSENKKTENFGVIRLKDQDSKKLFETLRLKMVGTDATDLLMAGKAKHGYNVSCYQQQRKIDKVVEHGCSIRFNYLTGTLLANPGKPLRNDASPELKEAYKGPNLQLLPATKNVAWVQINGEDAKALFSTLQGEAVPKTTNLKDFTSKSKALKNVVCYEHTPVKAQGQPRYACSFILNYNTGLAGILTQ